MYYTIDGKELNLKQYKVLENGKACPIKCLKCGGSGSYYGVTIWGNVCFKCQGSGKNNRSNQFKVFKSLKSAEKARLRKEEKRIETEQRRQAHISKYSDIIQKCDYLDNNFSHSVKAAVLSGKELTENQINAIIKSYDKKVVSEKRKVELENNIKQYIGKRVNVSGVVTNIYASDFYNSNTYYIKTEDDHFVVISTSNSKFYDVHKDTRIQFSAKVKKINSGGKLVVNYPKNIEIVGG